MRQFGTSPIFRTRFAPLCRQWPLHLAVLDCRSPWAFWLSPRRSEKEQLALLIYEPFFIYTGATNHDNHQTQAIT